MLEIEYEFREKDLLHFNELRLANDQELQKKIRQNRFFVPGVMLAIGLFYYVHYADMTDHRLYYILAVAWGISSPFITEN